MLDNDGIGRESEEDQARRQRRSILGIDLLEQAAAERKDVGGSRQSASKEDAAAVPKAESHIDNKTPSPYYGQLQVVVDDLFEGKPDEFSVRRLDVVIAAESNDLTSDLMEIVELLPPGNYSRKRLCTQLNSAIGGHAWGQVYGTVV